MSSASNSIGAIDALAGTRRDLRALALIGLHRRLAAGDAGDDDVAVVRGRLLHGDHEVAVEDAELDHRVAAHPQHEQLALAGEVGRHGDQLFDVLLGEHVGAGGDVADERDVADGPAFHHDAGVGVPADLDGTRLGRVAPKVAEAGERVEVGVHGRR